MKKKRKWFGCAGLALLGLTGCGRPAAPPLEPLRADVGPLQVWSEYSGRLESRRVHTILSLLGGQATLVQIAPEGVRVEPGDVLARLDSTRIEREIVKLEGVFTAARSDYERLKNAEWPLKLGELEWQRAEAQGKEEDERRFLEDSRPLLAEGLVTAQEIRQQEGKVAQAAAKTRQLEEQIRLSREVLQPLSLEQAQAKLTAAEQELALARQELAACVIRAPAGGVVGYLPAYLGGEYRPARVGDALFVNLPFMVIPDMSRLVVHCFVPEAELGRLAAGGRAEIIPIAFSDLILTGKVESVGATAQAAPERPAWQKYFRVVIAVEGGDERLRSGMTVTARILSYENPAALRLPRVAIHWKDRESFVYLLRQGRTIAQPVQLGGADDRFVEIRAGLQPGDPVAVDAPP